MVIARNFNEEYEGLDKRMGEKKCVKQIYIFSYSNVENLFNLQSMYLSSHSESTALKK